MAGWGLGSVPTLDGVGKDFWIPAYAGMTGLGLCSLPTLVGVVKDFWIPAPYRGTGPALRWNGGLGVGFITHPRRGWRGFLDSGFRRNDGARIGFTSTLDGVGEDFWIPAYAGMTGWGLGSSPPSTVLVRISGFRPTPE